MVFGEVNLSVDLCRFESGGVLPNGGKQVVRKAAKSNETRTITIQLESPTMGDELMDIEIPKSFGLRRAKRFIDRKFPNLGEYKIVKNRTKTEPSGFTSEKKHRR